MKAVFHSIPFISLSSPFSGPSGFNAAGRRIHPVLYGSLLLQGGSRVYNVTFPVVIQPVPSHARPRPQQAFRTTHC